jgi:hypothetical protein
MSWAHKQVSSYRHTQAMTEISLEEAKRKLELFEKNFPLEYELWTMTSSVICHDTIEINARDSNRPGVDLQNLSVVDSTSTPCSNIKPEDMDPVNGDYGSWLRDGRGSNTSKYNLE